MGLRAREEIERSYAAAAQLLDNTLAGAQPGLAPQWIEVIDTSNRSGFDPSGYPNFTWSHTFRDRIALQSCVLPQVQLAYEEPVDTDGVPARVRYSARAEVFYPGQSPSLFARQVESGGLEPRELEGNRMLYKVEAGLRAAAEALPRRYHYALDDGSTRIREWLHP